MFGGMKGLLFITHQTDSYDYLQSAELALQGGCRQIQLRMKETSSAEVESVARQLKRRCDACDASLYIDDYVDICLKIKATGVHLGREDMSPSEARKKIGDDFVIGGTADSFARILELQRQGVNYIGLGPFRFTETKKNLSPVLGLEGYAEIIKLCRAEGINIPILAIGGINREDIPSIIRTGVAGIALSSTILRAADPIDETRQINNLINSII